MTFTEELENRINSQAEECALANMAPLFNSMNSVIVGIGEKLTGIYDGNGKLLTVEQVYGKLKSLYHESMLSHYRNSITKNIVNDLF